MTQVAGGLSNGGAGVAGKPTKGNKTVPSGAGAPVQAVVAEATPAAPTTSGPSAPQSYLDELNARIAGNHEMLQRYAREASDLSTRVHDAKTKLEDLRRQRDRSSGAERTRLNTQIDNVKLNIDSLQERLVGARQGYDRHMADIAYVDGLLKAVGA